MLWPVAAHTSIKTPAAACPLMRQKSESSPGPALTHVKRGGQFERLAERAVADRGGLSGLPRSEVFRDVGLDRLGGGHVGRAARFVPTRLAGETAGVERAGVAGVETNRRGEVGDGADGVAGGASAETAVKVGLGVIRL